jgi:uncharacterized MAPEG superfamily protein
MTSLAAQPAFVAYVVTLIVLCLNMLLLWAYSGAVRGKVKATTNQEDANGNKLVDVEPPEVARVLRAHTNATASIVPFLLLGLTFVLAGGSLVAAEVVFGVFTVARLAHSFAYLGGKQPWRSIFFGLGGLATLALIVLLVKALVTTA